MLMFPRILGLTNGERGEGFWRIAEPLRIMRQHGYTVGAANLIDAMNVDVQRYDFVLLDGHADVELLAAATARFRRAGKVVQLDITADPTQQYRGSSAHAVAELLGQVQSVSIPHLILADCMAAYPARLTLMPTYVDTRSWAKKPEDRKMRVRALASPHKDTRAFQHELLANTQNTFGAMVDCALIDRDQAYSAQDIVQQMQQTDIGLCFRAKDDTSFPSDSLLFGAGRSAILSSAVAMGVPQLRTLPVENTMSAWMYAIEGYLQNDARRYRDAVRIYEHATSRWDLASHAYDLATAFARTYMTLVKPLGALAKTV